MRDAVYNCPWLVLSPIATASVTPLGRRWQIVDGDEEYDVRRVTRSTTSGTYDVLEVWRAGALVNLGQGDLNVRVRLRDAFGRSASVDVDQFGRVPAPTVPFRGTPAFFPYMEFMDILRTVAPLSTVRLPLGAFLGVNLQAITEVELEFPRAAEVLLDDVELVP